VSCSMCPSCGYNLRAEVPIKAGRFGYNPSVGFMIDGERPRATPQVHSLLGVVLRAQGRIVHHDAVLNVLDSDAEDGRNLVSQNVHRARAVFQSMEIPFPIETIWGRGLRWVGPAHEEVPA